MLPGRDVPVHAACCLAFAPVLRFAATRVQQMHYQSCRRPNLSAQALVLALSGLLLPLPLKQHVAAQGGALLVALPRLPRLALLQAAVPQRSEQCRAFVSGARWALQVFVPGGVLDVASHPQQLSTSCWMQHTWLAVLAGFLLPTAAALILHWRQGAAWPGNELALVAAMEAAAAAARPGGRRRRTIAGSAEPARSDDGTSLSVAAPSSPPELPASGTESLASTPSFRSGVSISSVVSAGSGLSLSSGGKSGSSSGHSSGGKSSSSSALSPRAAQQRWAMIQALRRHPEWLLQPTQATRMQILLLGVPLGAAVWAALEVAARGY